MKKAIHFLVYSSIYLAICALVMCYQTATLFQLPLKTSLLQFVFFGTLCSYNFHWFLTFNPKPASEKVTWSLRNKNLHLVFFLVGLAGAAIAAGYLRHHWIALLASSALAFIYSAPKIPLPIFRKFRRIAIGKTIFLALAWTFITAVLPIVVSQAAWTPAMETFAVNRFFFIYPICILFDYRDRLEDAAEGIRSMVTQFNERGIDVIFWGSLGVAVFTAFILYSQDISGWVCVLLTGPVLLLAFLYLPSKKNRNDFYFYFVLDGLMMLSGLLLLLGSFA